MEEEGGLELRSTDSVYFGSKAALLASSVCEVSNLLVQAPTIRGIIDMPSISLFNILFVV